MRYPVLPFLIFIGLLISIETAFAQSNPYQQWFDEAYTTYPDIPQGILESIAFNNTRLQHLDPQTAEHSCTGMPMAIGVMGLMDDPSEYFNNTLQLVMQESGYNQSDILNDPRINILAFAATYAAIKQQKGINSIDPAADLPVLLELSEIPDDGSQINSFAQDSRTYAILQFLNDPIKAQEFSFPQRNIDLQQVFGTQRLQILQSTAININSGQVSNSQGQSYPTGLPESSSDYGPAIWDPAPTCNYSSRNGTSISAVTIHTVQGSYYGCISWFKNCSSNVSAHYVIRSSDGQVTQMVAESDKGWHVGSENPYTIGIEHEGYVSDPSWYTTAMYNSSAALVRDITNSGYGIGKVRTFWLPPNNSWNDVLGACVKIKGHVNYPNQTHTDPGVNWDWERYYRLIDNNPSTTNYTASSGTFYDPGGASGNYGDDQRRIYTIQPTNASSLSVNVQSFNLETGWDYLIVYNGNSTNASVIGKYTGTSIPSTFSPTGNAITFEFRSDCGINTSGWAISWSSATADVTDPTTTVNGPSGWQTGDFTASFSDADNSGGSGVDRRFFLVKEYTGTEWRSNPAAGFFADNFSALHSDWNIFSGSWGISSGLNQTDEGDGNTNIYAPLAQNNSGAWLYKWRGKISGSGTNKRYGLHFFCDNANQSNRGNSYFVYFREDGDLLQFYKVTSNTWTLMKDVPLTVNANQWYEYKLIYDPGTGKIEVFIDDVFISSWTDPSPLTSGNHISFRTGNCIANFDDLAVYKERNSSNVNITVGNGTSDMIRYQSDNGSVSGRVQSVVIDNAGNFSSASGLDYLIDWTTASAVTVNDGNGADEDTTLNLTQLLGNWSSSSDAQSGVSYYQYAIGSSPGSTDILNWTNTSVTSTSQSLTLNSGTTYYLSVRTVNGAGLTSSIVNSDGILALEEISPCTVTGNSSDEFIQKVCVNNACNNSGDDGGYGDYSNIMAQLLPGKNYSLKLFPGFTGTSYPEFWQVFIDYSGDGDFDDAGELVMSSTVAQTGMTSGNLLIPPATAEDTTWIRFRMDRNSPNGSCDNATAGEIEDYRLWITDGCIIPYDHQVTGLTGNSATLNWSGRNAWYYIIKIREAGDNKWYNFVTADNFYTFNGILKPEHSYEYKVKAVCNDYPNSAFGELQSFTTIGSGARTGPGFSVQLTAVPNPFTDVIYVSIGELIETGQLRLLSIDGKEILRRDILQSDAIMLDMDPMLSSGMYILELNTGADIRTLKMLKN